MPTLKGLSRARRRCTGQYTNPRGVSRPCWYTCLAGKDHCAIHGPDGNATATAPTPRPSPLKYQGRGPAGWKPTAAVKIPEKRQKEPEAIPGLNRPTAKPEARAVPTHGEIKW